MYYLPIFIIVMSNVAYHLSAKSVPKEMDSLFFLSLLYLVAGCVSFAIFILKPESGLSNVHAQIRYINWVPFLFAFGIIGLELGNILMYRVGWNMSVGSLVANILLGIALIAIGYFLYKESISMKQMAGIAFCMIGLVLINRS
ncbi:MAG TPA: EamA family transporter [Clostridia bacterium]|nr:EamA family transporter [Clostridia bacterium]